MQFAIRINAMKHSAFRRWSIFCLITIGFTLALSAYGWRGFTQTTQDPPRPTKKSLSSPKKALGERLFDQRVGEAPSRPRRDVAPSLRLSSCNPALAPNISLGGPLSGALEPDDCTAFIGDGTRTDIYQFNGTQDARVVLLLNSPNIAANNFVGFDAYLFLLGADLTIIAQDDDGGGGTNARIPALTGFFTLPTTGTYYVVVNSFAPNEAGAYQVSVTPAPTSDLQFYPLTSPVRLLDTRSGVLSAFSGRAGAV